MPNFSGNEKHGDSNPASPEIDSNGSQSSKADSHKLDKELPAPQFQSKRDSKDAIGGDRAEPTRYCDDLTPEREKLERATFFLSPSVIRWLKFWAQRHKMRSPSQFLNQLLIKLIEEFKTDE